MKNIRLLLISGLMLICIFGNVLTTLSASSDDSVILSNFDIFETDLRDVFRSLAEVGDYNVLLDPSVKGQATIKLKNGLPVKQAIEYLAQTYTYSFRWINETRTVLIGDEKTFSNFTMKETRIYPLKYSNANEVADALGVVVDKTQIGKDYRTNQLTIKASILEHQNIEELIRRLDRLMPQINIEVRIEEVSKKHTKELGVDWDFNTTTSDLKFRTTAVATLQMLEDNNNAKLIAKPNVSVTDGQEGKIFLGDKVPIITTSQTDKGLEYTINYIEVGTKLAVIPRVNDDNTVTVAILAGVASITAWKTSGGSDVPLIRTREASSVVRLKDGDTFVLSGLNYNSESQQKTSVPGLAKIPLLGKLFSKEKAGENDDTEVMIFITPKVVAERQPIEVSNSKNQPVSKNTEPAVPVTQKVEEKVVPVSDNKPVEAKTEEVAKEIVPTNTQTEEVTEPEQLATEEVETEPVKEISLEDKNPVREADDVYKLSYTVKSGDSIASLTKKFGITKENIKNGQSNILSSEVKANQTIILEIPQNHLYILKEKETLWRISKRYGVSVELLQELNNIKDLSKLSIGEIIILPAPNDKIADSRF